MRFDTASFCSVYSNLIFSSHEPIIEPRVSDMKIPQVGTVLKQYMDALGSLAKR
jgi:hypothetical protein